MEPDEEPTSQDTEVAEVADGVAELTLPADDAGLASLEEALSEIVVTVPEMSVSEIQAGLSDRSYPHSYKSNTRKELHMLACCENFQRQYTHLYPDRKPLLLAPKNECGIEKFICTTLRPTQLKFVEVYDYDGCAAFVADYLNFEPLDPPIDLPAVVPAPTSTLARQEGNAFDYSMLLCSLLIGAGYDAYVVNGYATREITLMDETREVCPLLKESVKTEAAEVIEEERKYAVKEPRDLTSRFEAKMLAKVQAEENAKEEKERSAEALRIAELEKPPPDKLYGLRIHCWVLVLSGKREVPESFFIEPLTGQAKALDFASYLGIESLWNHCNLWVNMQDCSGGIKNMLYDLGDPVKWEFMLPNSDKPLLVIPEVNDEPLELEDEEEHNEEQHVDVPPSWVEQIAISASQFHTRCPKGKKTVIYKKGKLEKFCEYLNVDGLVTRITIYNDNELKNQIEVQEMFAHRNDKLTKRVHNTVSGWVTEYFSPGRPRALKEHSYKKDTPGTESERNMLFYSSARVDGLSGRDETEREMSETYVNRDDFLSHRGANFSHRVKKFEPQGTNFRPITKMVEKFLRNKVLSADNDVSQRIFMTSEDKILVKYHLEEQNITSSTREFIKPPNFSLDKSAQLQMTPDMTSAFQVDPYKKTAKELDIYNTMVQLLQDEKKCVDHVRGSELEVREILDERMREEMNSELTVSVYDTERNEKAKLRREELERQKREEELRKRDMELDYLAPFLARIGTPEKLSSGDAARVKEECLLDLKQRLIDKANLIQARFEKETDALQKKQVWYQENQMNMTKEDEDDYLNFCSEAMFRIHILELRLSRHKELAPQKYMCMDEKLREDSRLRT